MARLSRRTLWDFTELVTGKKERTVTGSVQARFLRTDKDGTQWVQMPGSDTETPVNGAVSADAKPGDLVDVSISNGRLAMTGNGSSPSVGRSAVESIVRPVSELAKEAKDVAEAVNQFFWHDTNGAHISTEEGNPAGAQNALWNSLGMLFRNGTNNLLALVTGNAPGMLIYDGAGNADGNIVASFVGNLIELGRNGADSVIKLCGGLGTIETSFNDYVGGVEVGSRLHYTSPYGSDYEEDAKACIKFGSVYEDEGGYFASENPYCTISARYKLISPNPINTSTDLHPLTREDVYELPHPDAYFMVAQTQDGTVIETFEWEGQEITAERYVHRNEASTNVELIEFDNRGGVTLKHNASGYVSSISMSNGDIALSADNITIDAQATRNKLARHLGLAKTAGDTITATGLRIGGYITGSKTECKLTVQTPFRFYGVTSCTISGTYTVRQNNTYLFGSTANTPFTFAGHYNIDSINSDLGTINVTISTGATQSAATNNDPASIVLNSCTITLT